MIGESISTLEEGDRNFESLFTLDGSVDSSIWIWTDKEIEYSCRFVDRQGDSGKSFPYLYSADGAKELFNQKVGKILPILTAEWEHDLSESELNAYNLVSRVRLVIKYRAHEDKTGFVELSLCKYGYRSARNVGVPPRDGGFSW